MDQRQTTSSSLVHGFVTALCLSLCAVLTSRAQCVLGLDSCRSLALHNNKQLNISRIKRDIARNTRKAARTKYLPKVGANGMYQYTSREISILNKDDKAALSNMGTTVGSQIGSSSNAIVTQLVQQGMISTDQAQVLGNIMQQTGSSMTDALNKVGQHIRDAFDTDTRNLFTADIVLTQPIYMGGAITAANRMAKIGEKLADNSIESKRQATLFETDQAYWTVVSLSQKQKLVDSYLQLLVKLQDDIKKMIEQGVATRADGLKVAVKVNEAEMTKQKVDDGLALARMLLCQLCGIDLRKDIILEDESNDNIADRYSTVTADCDVAFNNRPELKMLRNVVDMSEENTRMVRAAYLPKVIAMGGYMVSNPCLFNGFERKLSGMFHIGMMVQVPVWSWFEGRYRTNATKAATTIAQMELDEAEEKIELQLSQSEFKVREARKRLDMADKNIASAKENLRCADIGFKEGVMSTTDVMAAQTAWVEAQSRKIDAEIDLVLANTALRKAMGMDF